MKLYCTLKVFLQLSNRCFSNGSTVFQFYPFLILSASIENFDFCSDKFSHNYLSHGSTVFQFYPFLILSASIENFDFCSDKFSHNYLSHGSTVLQFYPCLISKYREFDFCSD